MLETVMGAIYLALFLFVGGAFVYTGLRGLRGHDIALPTKSGSLGYFTGKPARVVGALSLMFGAFILYECFGLLSALFV